MDKRLTLQEVIARYVHDGQTVSIEGFGHLVPVAAGHEIIRQGRKNLTLARMSCDVLVDQLLAADCLSALISSFVGNSSAGSLHELRRRVEQADPSPLRLEEYSHGGMIARYIAGASKLPFHPIKSYRGSDIATANALIRTVTDPYNGGTIHVVPALEPDVAIIHAQRADQTGNVQAWGMLGVQTEVAFAGKATIVTVEEVVDEALVRADPNRTIIPSHVVDAIVECPRGAHPHAVQGYYDRDDAFSRDWSTRGRDPLRMREWIDKHIRQTRTHEEYLRVLGLEIWNQLAVSDRMSAPVNYGGRS